MLWSVWLDGWTFGYFGFLDGFIYRFLVLRDASYDEFLEKGKFVIVIAMRSLCVHGR